MQMHFHKIDYNIKHILLLIFYKNVQKVGNIKAVNGHKKVLKMTV